MKVKVKDLMPLSPPNGFDVKCKGETFYGSWSDKEAPEHILELEVKHICQEFSDVFLSVHEKEYDELRRLKDIQEEIEFRRKEKIRERESRGIFR